MRLRVNNGLIKDDADAIVGTVAADIIIEDELKRTIELGSELVPAVEEFIHEVNTGTFKPRTSVKRFEDLFKKYE